MCTSHSKVLYRGGWWWFGCLSGVLESLDWGAIEVMLVVIGRIWIRDQGTTYKPLGLKRVVSRLHVGLSVMGDKCLLSCPVAGHTVCLWPQTVSFPHAKFMVLYSGHLPSLPRGFSLLSRQQDANCGLRSQVRAMKTSWQEG